MKQQKKMSLIAWLMLASEMLLLLFVAEWLRVQYRKQEGELHHDIQTIFTNTYERLHDAALDSMVAGVLREKRDSSRSHIRVNYTSDHATMITIEDRSDPAPLPLEKNYGVISRGAMQDGGGDSIFRQIRIHQLPDTVPLPEQVTKALRIAVLQTAGDAALYKTNMLLRPDSNKLKDSFEVALTQKAFPFPARWIYKTTPSDSLFYYYPDHMAAPAALAVDGYRSYLLKALLPQIAFSSVLLLLTGLAFLLAYRNMKQQKQFGEQKDSFISNVSHELKTPVATTKVALEALSNYNALEDPGRSAKYLRMATWEMERLETMINRVMNTIQAEQGQMSLQPESLDLAALLKEITGMLQPLFSEKGISITWEQDKAAINVFADRAHLQGTLYNLLDNAVKYGGNRIHIRLSAKGGQVWLRIADNGKGIPGAFHQKVFERFFRMPSGNEHNVKGHGLGLSYARYIIKAHGGSLQLEDTPGGGATFIIVLSENTRHAS